MENIFNNDSVAIDVSEGRVVIRFHVQAPMQPPVLERQNAEEKSKGVLGDQMSVNTLFTTKVRKNDYPFGTPLVARGDHVWYIWENQNYEPQVTEIEISSRKSSTTPLQNGYRSKHDTHNTWVLGLDKEGYIHVAGDMHNENLKYWRSSLPFTSKAGFQYHPKAMATRENSYYSFHSNRAGELFYLARIRPYMKHTPGQVCMGLYRYSVDTRTWKALGVLPPPTADGQIALCNAIFYTRGGFVEPNQSVHWYQSGMATIKFGIDDQIHWAQVWNKNSLQSKNTHLVYMIGSPDGERWTNIEGRPCILPLHVTAHVTVEQGHFLAHAVVSVDCDDLPVIAVQDATSSPREPQRLLKWTGTKWVSEILEGIPYWIRPTGYLANNGICTFFQKEKHRRVYRRRSYKDGGAEQWFRLEQNVRNIVGEFAMKHDVYIGLGDNDGDERNVVLIKFFK